MLSVTEIGLNEAGRRQSAAVVARLAGEPLQAVYSSPRERALGMARAIAAAHDVTLRQCPSLAEIDFGEWEGQLASTLEGCWPEHWRHWQRGPSDELSPPGGETIGQFRGRVRGLLESMVAEHGDESIAVVTHGGTARALLLEALGAPTGSFPALVVGHGSLSEILHGARRIGVRRINDICHLGGLG